MAGPTAFSRALKEGKAPASEEALHLSGRRGMSWKYSCLKGPGMRRETWEGFCNSTFLPPWRHGVCVVVCAGGPEVLQQGAHSQHLTSEKGEEMPSSPVEPGPRGREALGGWEGGSGVPRGMPGLMSGVWQLESLFDLNAIC